MMRALASLRRLALHALGLAAAATVVASPAGAQTRIAVRPYVEVTQVVSVGLDDGDTDAYTGLAAGVDVSANTRRVDGQLSYRYEKRIGWGDTRDNDVHTGLAQARADIIPGTLQVNAGALAARSRYDSRGPIFGFTGLEEDNIAEVYGVYAGPDFARRIGDVNVAASYRLGYVHVDDRSLRRLPPIPGQIALDRYNSSTTHSANASVGQGVGSLPFGWTIGGGYVREDLDRLDQDYEGKYVRADIVVPISHSFALTAGVGYERIEASQQDIVRDALGLPVVTRGGNLIADPSKPRLTAFKTDGVIYDGGFIWRPGRRTELTARAGRRYGGTTVIGSFKHQINSAYGVTASVYDGVQSFGRLVIGDLTGVPLSFNVPSAGLNSGIGGIGGCVYGTEPGTGACFDDSFQSINTSNFRSRGVSVLLSGQRGPWGFGVGAGYNHRRYFAPTITANVVGQRRIIEESWTLTADATRKLSATSGVQVSAYAATGDSGFRGVSQSYGLGITASYYQRVFTDRLQGTAAIGLYHAGSSRADRTAATALVGLRYTF